MTNWTALRDAYGQATDVPVLIQRGFGQSEDDTWHQLWSRLCHQGTVYSASYAALPLLLKVAGSRGALDRVQPLTLMGAIIASDDIHGLKERPVESINPLLPELKRLTKESLTAHRSNRIEFIHLLQAESAFEGDSFWGRNLDHLADGEFLGECPNCGQYLRVSISAGHNFIAADDWTNPPKIDAERIPISPIDPERLAGNALRLHGTAACYGQNSIADEICYLFGSSSCPTCRTSLRVQEGISKVNLRKT